jgi:hypothetical protein
VAIAVEIMGGSENIHARISLPSRFLKKGSGRKNREWITPLSEAVLDFLLAVKARPNQS